MMKKIYQIIVLLTVILLTASSCKRPEETNLESEMTHVGQEGTIPKELRKVLDRNLFRGVAAFEGKALYEETLSRDSERGIEEHIVHMIDRYGEELASYSFSMPDDYRVITLTATRDGGFLFVLGFYERYLYKKGKWNSEEPFASKVIKCDQEGKVQFDVPFSGMTGAAFTYCLESDGHYYFFGTMEAPRSKTPRVSSCTDVSEMILDQQGNLLKSKVIAGSDFDNLNAVERSEDGFILLINSQSDDGDFLGSNSKGYSKGWVFLVNEDLEIVRKNLKSENVYRTSRIGETDGKDIYPDDPLLKDFDGGRPTAFMDYGDFYLIVSVNETGIIETPPEINAIWYETETVYSGYDKDGRLLFRAAVDN